MRADPADQLKLLDLQQLDARVAQLQHQRRSLPEIARITELTATHTETLTHLRDQQVVVDDLTAAQTKADADVEQVKARRTRDRDRMDQGLITNPKDLERMQHELESLERRIGVLEDEELEIMEQLEIATTGLDTLREEVAGMEARRAELVAARDARFAVIDGELGDLQAQRAAAAEGVPADLLALYEKLREAKGVGASELRARQCGGCRLTLDAAEVSRIRALAPEEVVRCEECQRILVRTAESGL